MKVILTRTGDRRYGIRVEPRGFDALEMSPAPGYDQHLPHDLVHFAVEEELEIELGVFGQLAAGGDAGTFRLASLRCAPRERARKQRRIKRRGIRLAGAGRRDAELSERAAGFVHHAWRQRSRRSARACPVRITVADPGPLRAGSSVARNARLSTDQLEKVMSRLDRLSACWAELEVGDSLVLWWRKQEDGGPHDRPCQRPHGGGTSRGDGDG